MPPFQNRCASCNAMIRWERTASGKAAPISIETGESHFIDCPQRREWRKNDPKPAPKPSPVLETTDGQRGAAPRTSTASTSLWD